MNRFPIPDYNSPAALKNFLEAQGMAMQKKFGQNFLVNASARRALIDALGADGGSLVWEVGPGLGCMTAEILSRGSRLCCFEIDRGFSRLLREFFAGYSEEGKFELVEGDVLKTWKSKLESGAPDRFFGNLPYNVAATLIADTIGAGARFGRAVVTVQKEVAQRMAARPNTENYSSFSVLCQWAYEVSTVTDLAAGNFWPRPNVDSRAVLLQRRADFPRCENPALFMRMQRALFSSRRKTIKNNLTQFLSSAEAASAAIAAAGLSESARAESLAVGDLLRLSDCITCKS